MMKRNKNKGFTLVELIVSMVIFGIVLAAICGFMIAGAKSYTRVNDRLTAEAKLQLAANRIAESIVDCNEGIWFVEKFTGGNANIKENSSLFIINHNEADLGANCSVEMFRWRPNATSTIQKDGIYYFSNPNSLKVKTGNYNSRSQGYYPKDFSTVLGRKDSSSAVVADDLIVDLLLDKVSAISVEFYDAYGQALQVPTTSTSKDKGKAVYTAKLTLTLKYGSNDETVSVTKTISLRNHPVLIYNG